ncbi:MAG: hypothetical protein WCD08_13430, partial [Steroidobacteraceae bacterium]
MFYSRVESASWLITPVMSLPTPPVLTEALPAASAMARVHLPGFGTDLSNQVWMVVLSGVAVLEGANEQIGFRGTLPNDWRRDQLLIPDNGRPALDFAISHYGMRRPDADHYWPVLSVQPGGCTPFAVPSAFLHAPHPDEYDEDLPNVPDAPTMGVAVDGWRPHPFSPLTDTTGQPIPNAYAGLLADIAAYGAATLHRVSY